jgi:hypothetical protein
MERRGTPDCLKNKPSASARLPFKQRDSPHLRRLGDRAELAAAVNGPVHLDAPETMILVVMGGILRGRIAKLFPHRKLYKVQRFQGNIGIE